LAYVRASKVPIHPPWHAVAAGCSNPHILVKIAKYGPAATGVGGRGTPVAAIDSVAEHDMMFFTQGRQCVVSRPPAAETVYPRTP